VKQRQVTETPVGGSTATFHARIERLTEEIQDEDRQRLLEPTSLPKVLRGFKQRPPANTALLSRIAFEAFKSRMWAEGVDMTDEQAERLFRGHSSIKK
jgi:hypothetical protein